MFFSQEMSLNDFIKNDYNKEQDYRLTLDTRDNTLVYAKLEHIRVPNFKKDTSITLDIFIQSMEKRDWTWLQDSRFKYLYVYLINKEVFICDRDNLIVADFFDQIQKMDQEKNKIASQSWMKGKIIGKTII
jgi:hypothetical protein